MTDHSGDSFDPSVNYDDASLALRREIEKNIADTSPLVGQQEDFKCLAQEYAGDAVYQAKVQVLQATYSSMRRTRGDGNCFFRAFGFAYLERLLQHKQDIDGFRQRVEVCRQALVRLKYSELTIEDFHDTFCEVLEQVERQDSLDQLLDTFNDQGYSDYLVVYLRLLVSGHLQTEADFFQCFMEGGLSVKEFCNKEVEPMARESDNIHVIALAAATAVPVRVVYMDRGGGALTPHDFPDGAVPRITLLYRPGHYDILYE